MNKAAVVSAFRASLVERIATLKGMRDAARAGTRVDGTHRPSNRGERAAVSSEGYLTAGLDARMGDIEAALAALDQVPTGAVSRVSAGAFVEVDEEGLERAFFVLPGGAGECLDGVTILSPSSPVVRPLLGLEKGDVAELASGDEVEVRGVS